jgi:uncharacterized lipoprotein YmbA
MKLMCRGREIVLLIGYVIVLVGCVTAASAPSRFYLLSPLPEAKSTPQSVEGESCFAIGIGPVEFPAYLDRPQIVTRLNANELKLAEFDKWAEPLKDNFTRILAENLSTLLCTDPIAVFPWRGSVSIDYQIAVELIRFDGDLGGEITLIPFWTIFGKGGRQLHVSKRTIYTEPIKGNSYTALVSAKSQAVAAFSRDIATEIKNILSGKTKQ